MAGNGVGGRYVRWYSRLLRLYPEAFRERFGAGMAQTFQDLCRERVSAGRGLFWLALWVWVETSVAIVRENTAHMSEMRKTVVRVALGALALLMVPLVASQVVEGWNWPPGAFVFTYVLFFLTGMAYALIARTMGEWSYKVAVGLALVAGFVMGWATMVHMSETEDPRNLVYFGVLAVGGVGAWLARLKAPGMARALFAMAGALAVVGVTAMVLSWGVAAGPVWNVGVMHGGFVVVFAGCGLLFRQAGLAAARQERRPAQP